MTPDFTPRWIAYRFAGSTSSLRTRDVRLAPQPEANQIFVYHRFSQAEFERLMIAGSPELRPLFAPEHGAQPSPAGDA